MRKVVQRQDLNLADQQLSKCPITSGNWCAVHAGQTLFIKGFWVQVFERLEVQGSRAIALDTIALVWDAERDSRGRRGVEDLTWYLTS